MEEGSEPGISLQRERWSYALRNVVALTDDDLLGRKVAIHSGEGGEVFSDLAALVSMRGRCMGGVHPGCPLFSSTGRQGRSCRLVGKGAPQPCGQANARSGCKGPSDHDQENNSLKL